MPSADTASTSSNVPAATASVDDTTTTSGSRDSLPWWRRPSPFFVLVFAFSLTMNLGMTMSSRPEMLINLACIARFPSNSTAGAELPFVPNPCSDTRDLGDALNGDQRAIALPLLECGVLPRQDPTRGYDQTILATANTPLSLQKRDSIFNAPRPLPGVDPKTCRRDVGVQKLTAQIQMWCKFIGGLLSVMTTGYWASLSDRFGRRRIMAICQLGLLLNDASFMVAVRWPQLVAYSGGYILLLGPMCDGLLGSLAAMGAALSAYVADSSPAGSLVAYFASITGCLMGGMTVGPILGAYVIHKTNDVLMPFKIALVAHTAFILLLLFIFPESLSTETRDHLAKKAAAAHQEATALDALERAWENEEDDYPVTFTNLPIVARIVRSRTIRRIHGRTRRSIRRLLTPIEPLRIFMPGPKDPDHPGRGKDWNLSILATALLAISITAGLTEPKIQYAIYAFGWDTASVGPFLSFNAACRFVVLIVLVPVITHYLKPYYVKHEIASEVNRAPQHAVDEAAATEVSPLLPPRSCSGETIPGDDVPSSLSSEGTNGQAENGAKGTIAFDHALLVCTLIIEVVGYIAISANVKASETLFVVVHAALALASPAPSCANSLALELGPKDMASGRLFGAIGILDALSGALLSPLIFNTLFSATVGTYPPAIFILATICFTIALIAVLFVRLPKLVR